MLINAWTLELEPLNQIIRTENTQNLWTKYRSAIIRTTIHIMNILNICREWTWLLAEVSFQLIAMFEIFEILYNLYALMYTKLLIFGSI